LQAEHKVIRGSPKVIINAVRSTDKLLIFVDIFQQPISAKHIFPGAEFSKQRKRKRDIFHPEASPKRNEIISLYKKKHIA